VAFARTRTQNGSITTDRNVTVTVREGAVACPIMCTSPTVLPAFRLEHVQSKSRSQRLSEGKKLPTLKIQSGEKGKAGANKRMEISKKVMAGVNQGGTSNPRSHYLRRHD